MMSFAGRRRGKKRDLRCLVMDLGQRLRMGRVFGQSWLGVGEEWCGAEVRSPKLADFPGTETLSMGSPPRRFPES